MDYIGNVMGFCQRSYSIYCRMAIHQCQGQGVSKATINIIVEPYFLDNDLAGPWVIGQTPMVSWLPTKCPWRSTALCFVCVFGRA